MSDIERLFRKELRQSKAIDPSQELGLVNDKSVETRVARMLLQKLFEGRLRVILVPTTTRRRARIVRASSLEQELVRGLRTFLEDKAEQEPFPTIMGTIPEEMIRAFAKRQGIPVKERSLDDVRAIIERLQARQPQTKAAMRKSFASLQSDAEKPV